MQVAMSKHSWWFLVPSFHVFKYIAIFITVQLLWANDGKWHHICQSWENKGGSWKLYKDGVVASQGTGLKTGHVIMPGGCITLGQEQDSLGGGFSSTELCGNDDKRQRLGSRAVHCTNWGDVKIVPVRGRERLQVVWFYSWSRRQSQSCCSVSL